MPTPTPGFSELARCMFPAQSTALTVMISFRRGLSGLADAVNDVQIYLTRLIMHLIVRCM